jgi:hypothetical protein
MRQRLMVVGMIMGLARAFGLLVPVLVMHVMDVPVRVLYRPVDVFVGVALGQVQPHSDCHQDARAGELHRRRITQCEYGGECAHERRGREVGAGARRSKLAQRKHEQDQAHPIADKTHGGCE